MKNVEKIKMHIALQLMFNQDKNRAQIINILGYDPHLVRDETTQEKLKKNIYFIIKNYQNI